MKLFITVLCFIIAGLKAHAFPDSIVISASRKYEKPGILQRLFSGNNYRDTWSIPVTMPVFNIKKVNGGFTIYELGGGQQTISLGLKDKDNIRWVLRTVDKNIQKALPPSLQNTFAEWIVQDMVSAAHPYAPIVAGHLAKALDLQAPLPQLFYVPDDPAFGEYRKIFANTVCMLERKDPTHDNSEALSTSELLEKLTNQNLHVDDISLLKARLLDMLLADWDRHDDQMKWGLSSRTGYSVYYPVIRDRDQAFFYSDGILLKVIQIFAMKHLTGFTGETNNLIDLNRKSWDNDRVLLKSLDEQEWKSILHDFAGTLNDKVLFEAVKKLPVEVFTKDGRYILDILKARRDGILVHGMSYYDFLF